MFYYLFVTGCQQNIYDSERITHLLTKMGYVLSSQKEASVIIIVACSVRQKPIDRIWGKLRVWKKINPKAKIILTGCVLESDKKKFLDKIDCFIDSKKIEKELPKKLSAISRQPSAQKQIMNYQKLKTESCELKAAFVPIMFGCNNFCSYCAVPYTRGRENSRPKEEIIAEIKNQVKNGAKHITLLGQNVNSYQLSAVSCQQSDNKKELKAVGCRLKASKKSAFVALLQEVEKIEGLEKISFLTSHPKDMSDELINWINTSKKFSRELHLPLQSGNNEILKRMNRNYTAEHYLMLAEKLSAISRQPSAKNNPKRCGLKAVGCRLHLSTDIIVGFPGETKEQFEDTYQVCKKIGFNKAYISQFSPRAGTPAAKMPDSVSYTEKKRRWEKLDNLINKKAA